MGLNRRVRNGFGWRPVQLATGSTWRRVWLATGLSWPAVANGGGPR